MQEAQKLGSVSASELDEAETDACTGEAALAQARASGGGGGGSRAKQKDLHDKSIIAPFAGRVVKKSAEVGEWLSTGDAVLEILSTSELERGSTCRSARAIPGRESAADRAERARRSGRVRTRRGR
ncbi:MAG: HlyD family efflux transporter periplasmic adaptor subunit [Phycisphaerales bacterium]